ncbi:T9SS type A sorting domain-containing protein, partial [bacterium]|nr:T9SS type A sorting domain-containing protein [bacterium]
AHWENITGDLPNVPVQDIAINLIDASTLYVGTDLGVFQTTNHGLNWEVCGSGFPVVVVDDLEMQNRTGMLRAGTHGRGLWQISTGSPSVSFLFPNGSELLAVGTPIEMRWAGEDFGGNVSIELNRNYPGVTWETLYASTPNDGAADWVVTEPVTDHARFRITHLTLPDQNDTTNADTRIVESSVRLSAPNGGEAFFVTANIYITFERLLLNDTLAIELNRDYPSGEWESIDPAVVADAEIRWLVRGTSSDNARMRICSISNPSIGDTSDADFSIVTPEMTLFYPNGGELLYVDSTISIEWDAPNIEGRVQISINRDYPVGEWAHIFSNTTNDGQQNWTVAEPVSGNCRMRVRAIMATEVEVISENDFEIQSLSTSSRATLPTAFRVLPAAPNPFNPETVITFELPLLCPVKVEVFDRLGRRVSVLQEETMSAGVHRVTFNGANLSSGIYFVRVQAGSEFDIAKVALVR